MQELSDSDGQPIEFEADSDQSSDNDESQQHKRQRESFLWKKIDSNSIKHHILLNTNDNRLSFNFLPIFYLSEFQQYYT